MAGLIAIVDYGLSNLTCVRAAVERVGYTAEIVREPAQLDRAERIILPGVGAFGDAMANLRVGGMAEALDRHVRTLGKPFLGICLGAHLTARDSDEYGLHEGLGWFDAQVRRIAPTDRRLRVPHTGWDNLDQLRSCPLFEGVPEDALFFYTHSHAITCDDAGALAGSCDYGRPIAGALHRDNIFAVQFHPEKSQRFGLRLLHNFLSRV